MSKIKLSRGQKDAIQLIRDGYELGHTTGYWSRVSLQKGGCGKGGETAKINFKTFYAISSRKLVTPIPNQSEFAKPIRYQLTELGKTIEL
jgi:hypothetical protein